jgi:hypothetical protein
MANSEKEKWRTVAAAAIVAAALALFVGVFLFFSNTYGETEEAQVTQNSTTLAPPGNELPIAPITPPAAPPIATPSGTPPITQ